MLRASKIDAFATTDFLAALLLAVAQREPRDDIALLEKTQALAISVGWHPIWDVLLVALTQTISDGWIGRDPIGAYRLTSPGKRHLAALLASPTAFAPPALQVPLAKLKRKVAAARNSAARTSTDRRPALRA